MFWKRWELGLCNNPSSRKKAEHKPRAIHVLEWEKGGKMNRKILLGVDEFTLVLSVDKETLDGIEDWEPTAESIITEFAQRANLESVYGTQKILEDKRPQGYSVAYQYGDNPFYFAVAYHPYHLQMGVVVKFSAHSWSVYCAKCNTGIKKFLNAVKSDSYRFRLSRIDFTVDYQDWDISIDDIYQNLMGNHLEIQDSQGRKNHSEIKGLEIDGVANTFYVGSKRTGTRLFLRGYNKRAEQIETKGFRFKEAINTKSWVRFEAVFKGDYAHQMTDIIMRTDEENMKDLIADKITEKYRFYDLGNKKYTDFSIALLEKSQKDFQRLRLESPRDNGLISSLLHLINGSGLFPVLYKCDKIWGNKTSLILLKKLHDIYVKEFQPNDDVLLWLKKHKSTLEKQSLGDELEIIKNFKKNETEN